MLEADLTQAQKQNLNLQAAFELQLQEKDKIIQDKDQIIMEYNIRIKELLQACELSSRLVNTNSSSLMRTAQHSGGLRQQRRRGHDLTQMLRDLIEANRRAEAANKTEAKKAAIGQAAGPRSYDGDRIVSNSLQSDSIQDTRTNQSVPVSTFEDMSQAFSAEDQSTGLDRLSKPIRLPYTVMINKDKKVMGNPFGSIPGWAMNVDLDAEADGQPSSERLHPAGKT